MTKKSIAIIAISILAIGAFISAGYKISHEISYKKAEEAMLRTSRIEIGYVMQNKAFFGYGTTMYLPYDYQWELQANLIFYMMNTGNSITLGDVERFLETPENPDGTPRIWEDDETGIIKEFVLWCYTGDNLELLRSYRRELRDVYDDYRIAHPDCQYRILDDLPPEQIIEVTKKHADPDFNLMLE